MPPPPRHPSAPGSEPEPAWSRDPRLVALLVAFVWFYTGTNYLAFKVASAAMPPLLVATLRLFVAGLILLPWALRRRRTGARTTGRELLAAAGIGVVMMVLGQALSIMGTHELPAGVAAVFAASSPLFIALLAWAVQKRPLARLQVLGIALGFAGLFLMGMGALERGGFRPGGIALMLSASLFWAIGSLCANRVRLPADTVVGLAAQLLPAGTLLLASEAATGALFRVSWNAVPLPAWGSLAFLVLVSTVLGYAAFLQLNRHVSPATANSFAYGAPVISLLLSAALLGERLTAIKLAAAAVALLGVAVMILGTPRRRPLPEIEPEATG